MRWDLIYVVTDFYCSLFSITKYEATDNTLAALSKWVLLGDSTTEGAWGGAGAPYTFTEPPIGTYIFEDFYALLALS